MFTALLAIIYITFISLGLPDALLGSAWPSIYGELNVPVSFAGIISSFITMKLNNRNMVRLGQAVAALGLVMLLLPLGNLGGLIYLSKTVILW